MIAKIRFGLANLVLFSLFFGSCLGVHILGFPWQHEWTLRLPAQPSSGTFSPDGKYLVTAGDDNKSCIFSIDNGEEITCIPWQLVEGEGRPGIPRAFFSSDGNYISVGNEFSHVWRAFDLKMGGRIYDVNTFMCQEGKLWLVDGYPDQVIVPTSKVEGSDIGSGTFDLRDFRPAAPNAYCISYSLDRERIAVVQIGHNEVQVWKRRFDRGGKGQLGRVEVWLAMIFGSLWLGRILKALYGAKIPIEETKQETRNGIDEIPPPTGSTSDSVT